jgi:type I restriction enzyme S subunit
MSNSIPEGWESTKIGSYVGVQSGSAFKSEDFCETGIPVVRISNIKKNGNVDLSGAVFTQFDPSLSRFEIRDGDVLIAMSGATTGKVGRYHSRSPAYLNQRVGRFYVRNNLKIELNFVHQITATNQFTGAVLVDAAGGAQPNISNQQIEAFNILLPPLPEQQKIATILSSVDNVIETTRAQIDKLKDLKTGMMHELLTKGIGSGDVPYTEFKDTAVGRVPVGWDVCSAGEVAAAVMVGVVVKPTQYYVESGVPALRSANVRENGLTMDNLKYFSEDSNEILKKSRLVKGDLLTVRTGYPGTTAVVTDEFEGCNCIDVIITRPSSRIDSDFFCLWVNSDHGKGQVLKAQGGLAQQKAIFNAVNSVTKKIALTEKRLTRLLDIKKALMQDLLTGKVRVKIDEKEKEPAVA